MDVESAAAVTVARRWWPQPMTAVSEGATIYLQSRVIARLFDLSFGRAGHSADAIHLFGGTYTIAFPQLRFDGPYAGLIAIDWRNQRSAPRMRSRRSSGSWDNRV